MRQDKDAIISKTISKFKIEGIQNTFGEIFRYGLFHKDLSELKFVEILESSYKVWPAGNLCGCPNIQQVPWRS